MLPRMSEVSPEQCRFWRDWPNSNFPLWRLSVQTTTECNATESGGSISPQNRVPQHPMVGLSTILPSKMVIGVWYTPCLDIQLISAFHPQHIPIKKISSTVCLFLMVKSAFWPFWRVFPPSCRHNHSKIPLPVWSLMGSESALLVMAGYGYPTTMMCLMLKSAF